MGSFFHKALAPGLASVFMAMAAANPAHAATTALQETVSATETSIAAQKPKYRIELQSSKVDSLGGIIPAVHNELVFFIHDEGTPIYMRAGPHGYANNAKGWPGVNIEAKLKVEFTYFGYDEPPVSSVVVFSGTKLEVLEKFAKTLEVSEYINTHDISYLPAGQNSNTAAGTFMQVIGLKLPHGRNTPWAPGAYRSLVPRNWKSDFDGMAQKTIQNGEMPQGMMARFDELRDALTSQRTEQSLADLAKACKAAAIDKEPGFCQQSFYFQPDLHPQKRTLSVCAEKTEVKGLKTSL